MNAKRRLLSWVLCVGIVALATPAVGFSEQDELVERARMTFERFLSDKNMSWFHQNKNSAKGLFIVPQLLRGAFFIGGSGGSGVLLVKDEKTGEWSEPAFYTMGSVSFGFQFGGDSSEIILVVRTEKGLEQFYSTDFKLGVDTSIAAGPVGAGASAKGVTADILAFARSKGAYAGVSVEGSGITVSDSSNRQYYAKRVRPVDILVKKTVKNPHSAPLREAVAKAIQ